MSDSFELVSRLDQVSTRAELEDLLGAHFGRCGVEHFAMLRLPGPDAQAAAPLHLVDRWPAEWLAHYDERRYVRHDPILRRILESLQPFAWSDVPVDRHESPTAFRIMSEAAEHGLAQGLAIPIFNPSGFQGLISIAGPELDPQPEVRRAVHLVSLWAFGAAERITAKGEVASEPLTDREREVLSWTAAGHSGAEVGRVLGISDRTVEAHLRSIRLKLGVRNTTHAAVTALQRKHIRL